MQNFKWLVKWRGNNLIIISQKWVLQYQYLVSRLPSALLIHGDHMDQKSWKSWKSGDFEAEEHVHFLVWKAVKAGISEMLN